MVAIPIVTAGKECEVVSKRLQAGGQKIDSIN